MTETATRSALPDAPPPVHEAAEKPWRKYSLRIAGLRYSLGDISMLIAGVLKGADAKKEAAAGATWFTGGVAAALFGNEKPERKLRRMRRELSEFLTQQGVKIPEGSCLSARAIEKESHIYDHIGDFLYRNPSQVLNGSYAAGALMLFKSGFDQRGADGNINKGVILSGAAVEAGALGGLLIPEYKTPPQKKPHGVIEQTTHWLRSKPLKFSGIMYWINNIGLLTKAIGDKAKYAAHTAGQPKHANKSYLFSFATLGLYVVANLMLLITPKEEANKKQPLDTSSLNNALAEVIAAQPGEAQQTLLHQLAGYMALKPEIGRRANAIAAAIASRMPARGTPAADAPPQAPAANPPPHWQDKIQQAALQPAALSISH